MKYGRRFKNKVLKAVNAGMTLSAAKREFGVAPMTIKGWKRAQKPEVA